PGHDAAETRLLFGLADGRVPWSFAWIDGAFRHDPALAGRRGHERDLNAILADPVKDHGRLMVYTRHRSSPSRIRPSLLVASRHGNGLQSCCGNPCQITASSITIS